MRDEAGVKTYNAIEDEIKNEEDLDYGKLPSMRCILRFLMTWKTYGADNDFDDLLVSCYSETLGNAV